MTIVSEMSEEKETTFKSASMKRHLVDTQKISKTDFGLYQIN